MRYDECQITRYRIVVDGRLSERFAAGFFDLSVESSAGRSVLTGDFRDQAQLFGVLDRLRDLGIGLVSVDAVG